MPKDSKNSLPQPNSKNTHPTILQMLLDAASTRPLKRRRFEAEDDACTLKKTCVAPPALSYIVNFIQGAEYTRQQLDGFQPADHLSRQLHRKAGLYLYPPLYWQARDLLRVPFDELDQMGLGNMSLADQDAIMNRVVDPSSNEMIEKSGDSFVYVRGHVGPRDWLPLIKKRLNDSYPRWSYKTNNNYDLLQQVMSFGGDTWCVYYPGQGDVPKRWTDAKTGVAYMDCFDQTFEELQKGELKRGLPHAGKQLTYRILSHEGHSLDVIDAMERLWQHIFRINNNIEFGGKVMPALLDSQLFCCMSGIAFQAERSTSLSS